MSYTVAGTAFGILIILWLASARWLATRVVMMAIVLFLTGWYLLWRLEHTIIWRSPVDLLAGGILLLAEIYGLYQQIGFYYSMAWPRARSAPEWPSDRPLPTVAIWVPTYNESLAVLRRTLTACTLIEYPHDLLEIWVLDDGDRPEIQQLAHRLGIIYVTRPTHEHAKAGNLNAALRKCQSELIAILDADMVPKPTFIGHMVPYLVDDTVAFAQAPQAFFNPDPFQHNLAVSQHVPNEQDFFMRDMLAGRDRWNATMFVGTNAIFRRQALEKVGGFVERGVTEDVTTGMALHANGYQSVFVREVLVKGLAPESLGEYIHQRVRWGSGNLQALKTHNPLKLRGLTVSQRLIYLTGLTYWYFGLQKMVFLIFPALYPLFGISAIHATVAQLIMRLGPPFLGSLLIFDRVSEGHTSLLYSLLIETLTAPFLAWVALRTSFSFHGGTRAFRVTQKNLLSDRYHVVLSAFIPIVLLNLLTWAALLRIVLARGPLSWHNPHGDIMAFWLLFNIPPLLIGLWASVDRPRRRAAERIPASLPISCISGIGERVDGTTVDLSERGVHMISMDTSPVLSNVRLYLGLDTGMPIRIEAELVRQWLDKDGLMHAICDWQTLDDTTYQRLLGLLWSKPDDIPGSKIKRIWGLYSFCAALRTLWATLDRWGHHSGEKHHA